MTATAKFSEGAAEAMIGLGQRFVTWLGTSGLKIVVILLLAWAAARLVNAVSARLERSLVAGGDLTERAKRAETLASVVQTVGGILILAGAFMMILREVGLDVGPLIATAGIGGLAVGFGAQTLVKDVITGFFILLEDQIRVADVVEVAGKTGIVETIGLRTTRLRDVAGTVHQIPNSSITVVSNMTKDFSRYVAEIPVGEKADLAQVFEAVKALGDRIRSDPDVGKHVVEPIELLGVDAPTRAPLVKARITTRPGKQWEVARKFNLLVREEFAARGIELR